MITVHRRTAQNTASEHMLCAGFELGAVSEGNRFVAVFSGFALAVKCVHTRESVMAITINSGFQISDL